MGKLLANYSDITLRATAEDNSTCEFAQYEAIGDL